VEIAYRFGFDAAHHFDHFPEGHPNRRLHGHSFLVEVALEGEPDPATGFIADFGDVDAACAELRARLDHRMLNDIGGLEKPSLENLSRWIWNELRARLPSLSRVTVRRDSAGQSCTYKGPGKSR
jgi:6-pyruvoyltetrahydropterin/6-carboxytetrahydropterin synthase